MSIVSNFLKQTFGLPEINVLHPTSATVPAIESVAQTATTEAAKVSTLPILTAAGTVILDLDPKLIDQIDDKIETAVRGALTRYGVPAADQDAAVKLIESELNVLL